MRTHRLKDRFQVALICRRCGARHHDADRFCARCGHALIAFEAAESAALPALAQARPRSRILARMALPVVLAGLVGLVAVFDRPGKLTVAGVEIGDSPAQVEKVLGKPALPPAPMDWKPGHRAIMWHYDPDATAGGVPNLSVTFLDGRVGRVAALDKRYPTGEGLRVGDDLDKARRLYGTALQEDPSGDLFPFKFVHGSEVVKIIVQEGKPDILAIGIETPDNVSLHDESSGPDGGQTAPDASQSAPDGSQTAPGSDEGPDPHAGLPLFDDGNETAL